MSAINKSLPWIKHENELWLYLNNFFFRLVEINNKFEWILEDRNLSIHGCLRYYGKGKNKRVAQKRIFRLYKKMMRKMLEN